MGGWGERERRRRTLSLAATLNFQIMATEWSCKTGMSCPYRLVCTILGLCCRAGPATQSLCPEKLQLVAL